MKRKRKNYSPEEKVAILKRKVAVSDLCDEYSLQPTIFYRWQKGHRPLLEKPCVKRAKRRIASRCLSRSCNVNTKCSPSSWRST